MESAVVHRYVLWTQGRTAVAGELLFCFGGRCDIALNLDTVPIRKGESGAITGTRYIRRKETIGTNYNAVRKEIA